MFCRCHNHRIYHKRGKYMSETNGVFFVRNRKKMKFAQIYDAQSHLDSRKYCCWANSTLNMRSILFLLRSDICHYVHVQLKLHFPSVLLHSNSRMSGTRRGYHSYFLVAFRTLLYVVRWWISLHSMTCWFLHPLVGTAWLHFRRKLKR